MKLIPNLAHIDKQAVEECDIPSLSLMEQAGRHVSNKVIQLLECLRDEQPQVTIVAGFGNNGGDGFVCARWLAIETQSFINVILMASPEKLKGDALHNFELIRSNEKIKCIAGDDLENVYLAITEAQIIVDALFGSGLKRSVEGDFANVVELMNQSKAQIVSVDLPSGIDGATGNALGKAVEADYTVTFAVSKPGLYLAQGKEFSGDVSIVDIGIPQRLINEDQSRFHLITKPLVKQWLPKRKNNSYKNKFGHVLVVAGSFQMPGAAKMTTEAVLRMGAGLVTLAAPQSMFQSIDILSECIRCPLPESSHGTLCVEAFTIIEPLIHQYDVIVYGPGTTTESDSQEFANQFIKLLREKYTGSVVLDADGLNCVSKMGQDTIFNKNWVLTPHLGEASRLLNQKKNMIEMDLMHSVKQIAEKYESTTVLKSSSTVIYNSSLQQYWINPLGNNGMATAGSGDILTGLIAGLLAQGISSMEAANAAVYLHGLSGDIAARELTAYCMIATDLLGYLPFAIKQVQD